MEEREKNMIRLGCLRDAVATVDIEQRTGFFDIIGQKEDVSARINLWYNKYLQWITEGTQMPDGFATPTRQAPVELSITQDKPKEQKQEEPEDATEKQKKMIWGLVYGTNGDLELEEWLKPLGLDRYTVTKKFINKKWASEFIEKNKKID
jgi:hypothetical protein